MSLLSICQGAASALSLPAITAVVGSSLANPALLLTLAKREGRELMRRHNWRGIVTDFFFTCTAAQQQEGSIPSDFDRFLPDSELLFSEDGVVAGVPMPGPTPTNTWVRTVAGDPFRWRLFGGDYIHIAPAPSASAAAYYVYVSKNYCESSGGTGQEDWLADADVGRIPEHLIELGITWRWLRAKGMDYAEEMATYEREVEKAASRDQGPLPVKVIHRPHRDFYNPTWNGTIIP